MKVRSVSPHEPCFTVPCQNEGFPYKCPVCLLRACISSPWKRLQINSSSPVFVSARVIDACGVGIRSVIGVRFCMGRSWVVSEVYALTFQEKVWDFDFCAPEIYRVFTMTWLIDLLSSCAYTYICLLTYSNINVKLFQEITQNSKRSFCLFWFTFVFTGHFLYLRADSTQTSGVAKASSTSLPASLATENYQVCHPVLAPLWSKSSGCRHYLHLVRSPVPLHILQNIGKQKSCLCCLAGYLLRPGKEMWGAPPVSESRSPKSTTHYGKLPSWTVPLR